MLSARLYRALAHCHTHWALPADVVLRLIAAVAADAAVSVLAVVAGDGLIAALVPLWRSPNAFLLLSILLVLPAAWVVGFFGRSRRRGCAPLITCMVEVL